jgi:hypothetical protein
MTASTAEAYGILGLTSDATLADVKKAYRKLARQHHPDRNNADPGAIDRFRRITEAYEYLSAHLKDNAHGNGHSRPGPTAPPRADAGMPEDTQGRQPRATMPKRPRQAIRACHREIPRVVIIIASGTTGWTPDGATSTSGGPSTPPAPDKDPSHSTTQSHIFEGGTAEPTWPMVDAARS